MTTPLVSCEPLHDVRCDCGFRVGFSRSPISEGIICPYCHSEQEFFFGTFSGTKDPDTLYIYGGPVTGVETRRGEMFELKEKIRSIYNEVKGDKDE